MNVWQLVTNNSTLPVSPANTFWDHLNNLGGGSGGGETIHVFPLPIMEDEQNETVVNYQTTETLLIEHETQATVEVLSDDEVLQFLEEEITVYVDT